MVAGSGEGPQCSREAKKPVAGSKKGVWCAREDRNNVIFV